jgi:type III pantothenate kinase
MILCLDIGNTHIFGGVFQSDELQLQFRHDSHAGSTSDQLGIFLKTVLRENHLSPENIANIGVCSVVPSVDYSLRAACKKYFNIDPFFLGAGAKTGIVLKVHDHTQTGPDLIAGAIGAKHYHPNQNLFIVDLGTAITITALSKTKEFLGVAILPGLNIAMHSLASGAAKLFPVAICKPTSLLGRSTTESIQLGLYYGHLGAIKEIIAKMSHEFFPRQNPLIIGTGGFAHLFEDEQIYDHIIPDLVLQGMRLAIAMNCPSI